MLENLIETYGEGAILMAVGGLVGVLFGATAQHSRFCLRAATVEVAEGKLGPRLSVWLIAFSSGVLAVQSLIVMGWLDVSESRQLATTGSMSGAIIGGLMFGVGMILARGCASRLLVLDGGSVADRQFADLVDLLRPGDFLVMNDTRVIPARLRGRKRLARRGRLPHLHSKSPAGIIRAGSTGDPGKARRST